MKKRIIGLILVVVMLACTLVSCGFNYEKENLALYTSFDLEAFKNKLVTEGITIENGDFKKDDDGSARAKVTMDTIYGYLASAADDKELIVEGVIGAHDVLLYCYYVTADFGSGENEERDVVLFASSMQEDKAVKLQFGLGGAETYQKLIEEKLSGVDLKDKVYTTVTEGVAEAGKVAYVTYTVTAAGAEKGVKHTNERVVLGEGDVGSKLAGTEIGEVSDELKEGFQVGDNTYTGAVVNWVVEKEYEISFTDVTYTEAKSASDVTGTSRQLKDVELTYHVFPVSYYKVEEFSADSIIKTLLSTLSAETVPSFEGHSAITADIDSLKTKYESALKDYETAAEELESAQAKLATAQGKLDANPEDASAQNDVTTYTNQVQVKATSEQEKKGLLDTAESELNTKIAELYTAINAEDAEAAKSAIVEDYKKSVHDMLLEEYNKDIKMKLADKIWALMQEYSVMVSDVPEEATEEIYDILIENHEYNFYNGTYDSTTKESNYKHYNGSFRRYLVEKVGAADYTNAKHVVWAEAEAYVADVIKVYHIASLYGVSCTEADYKTYEEDEENYYSYNEYTYGKTNVRTAVQFDKLMNYLLETTEDEGGDLVFNSERVKFTFAE